MLDIKMVDLNRQYDHIRSEINDAMQMVIDSGQFIGGKMVDHLEAELARYLGVKHVITCGNGTDALQIALMALKLPPGSEVICPTFNYVSAAEACALLGLKPKFIDADAGTFCMDAEQLSEVLSPETKAIIPVHLFGQSCDMHHIMKFAHDHNLHVIEDTAQSIGATYNDQQTGSMGDLGITSFFPSKNLGAFGDGGAIFTDSDALAHQCRIIKSHGQDKKYHFGRIGMNSRLDHIQAAILGVKLNYLNDYTEQRRKAADYYHQRLKDVGDLILPETDFANKHVFHQYTIRTNHRDELRDHLIAQGVPTMIYYPVPLHRQPAYEPFADQKEFPVSEKLCAEVLSLPMHTELNEEQLEYITGQIIAYFKG